MPISPCEQPGDSENASQTPRFSLGEWMQMLIVIVEHWQDGDHTHMSEDADYSDPGDRRRLSDGALAAASVLTGGPRCSHHPLLRSHGVRDCPLVSTPPSSPAGAESLPDWLVDCAWPADVSNSPGNGSPLYTTPSSVVVSLPNTAEASADDTVPAASESLSNSTEPAAASDAGSTSTAEAHPSFNAGGHPAPTEISAAPVGNLRV
ncbi:hypothetical protein C8T65DRAFT_699337 [Cerioporus squamosus]|nr:hypothetical protein C8T65DRAFT_699690 [Cerioporus squamosus]KAI0693038.1 hypothetical protein C8T65DRAFT_699337 [Cerioporus squamosus]